MDQNNKALVRLLLSVLKDVYQKTTELEKSYDQNFSILSGEVEPFSEIMTILQFPEEKQNELAGLMELYFEGEMTLDEILIAFEMATQQQV